MAMPLDALYGIHGLVIALCVALVPMPFCFVAIIIWLVFSCSFNEARDRRVVVRAFFSPDATFAAGSFFVAFPHYISSIETQKGPFSGKGYLPLPGQKEEVDVPEVVVMVEKGLYSLKINTKVMGVVLDYTIEDLVVNRSPIGQLIYDSIATTLRKAVHDLSLQEALVEIQRIFSQDAETISSVISVPCFKVTQLLLDPNQSISANTPATQKALDIMAQQQQESAKRKVLEASMETEEQKVRLQRVTLQGEREAMMLQQEIYGKEGAAMVEAAKHAKNLFLCVGTNSPPAGWTQVNQ